MLSDAERNEMNARSLEMAAQGVPRYHVTGPIRGGNQWWNVHDKLGEYPNQIVATFYAGLLGSEDKARNLCQELNNAAE